MVRKESSEILTSATHGAVKRAGGRYNFKDVEKIKEVAADHASPDYLASQAGKNVSADPSLSKDIADGARRQLEKRVPGIRGMNTKIQEARVAQQVLKNAYKKEGVPVRLGPIPTGIELPREGISKLGFWLDDPKTHALMQQSPRAFAEMMKQLIYTDQPDATSGQ
jgi:hypothetical protein